MSNRDENCIISLASALDAPPGTVARELSGLEKAGILESETLGKQKYYSPSAALPIMEDLRNIFLKTMGATAELKAAVERLSGVELAFVFGSYAGGRAGPGSDLDLMVIGDVADRDMAPAAAKVERRLKREINYTIFARDEAEKRIGKKGDFVHEVFSGPKILIVGRGDDELFEAPRRGS